jgi:DNA-binding GntR family transcriptional regulator
VSSPETIPTDPEDDAPVYDRLRADIIAGVYAPGGALRFAEMQRATASASAACAKRWRSLLPTGW